ncbi:MAG: hypothetical protein KDB71_05155 [Mycobacterium sp.]|nr:hypothetical protein [Mycobacterium sp.]
MASRAANKVSNWTEPSWPEPSNDLSTVRISCTGFTALATAFGVATTAAAAGATSPTAAVRATAGAAAAGAASETTAGAALFSGAGVLSTASMAGLVVGAELPWFRTRSVTDFGNLLSAESRRDCPVSLGAEALAARPAPLNPGEEAACAVRAALVATLEEDADEESPADALALPESVGSAQATAGAAPAAMPTPRATASPPTRPM